MKMKKNVVSCLADTTRRLFMDDTVENEHYFVQIMFVQKGYLERSINMIIETEIKKTFRLTFISDNGTEIM